MTVGLLAQAQNLTRVDTAFIRLVDQALSSPLLAAVAIAAAVGVGAVHALTPGHGKAIGAAYLVGGRGRTRDALLLGITVAAMHTVSVLALAATLHFLLRDAVGPPSMGAVTPIMRVVSGVLVIGLGIALLVSQWRRRRHEREHGHDHALPPEVSPFSRKGLVILGLSGGLLPSPSAFLVLVTAWFTGKAWLGLLLVGAFSIGLAASLTLIGVAAVRGRELLTDRVSSAAIRRVAVGAAVIVLAGGIVMTTLAVLAL
jgi:ABC-type nickel/cobalt efflux system permease component RcnA